MSNAAWCVSNKDGTGSKFRDKCPNVKRKCQKQVTFTPRQFQLEGAGYKNELQKKFQGKQTTLNKFFRPAVIVAAPFFEMAFGGKT